MSLRDDLNYGLAAFGVQIPERLRIDEWCARATGMPARNTLVVVGASALLFYHFERGRNPKVNEWADALLYTSTCLSVGYADVHPVTRAGKLLGTWLMTFGPALAARALDGPAAVAGATGRSTQDEILATLRLILSQLEAQSRPAAAPPPSATAADDQPPA